MIEFDAELLRYEVVGAWWPGFVPWGWAQTLVAKYFLWRVLQKHRRYKTHVAKLRQKGWL